MDDNKFNYRDRDMDDILKTVSDDNNNQNEKINSNPKKKFVVHIDEDELNYSSDDNKSSDSASVYFSNFKGKKASATSYTRNQPLNNKYETVKVKPEVKKKKKRYVGSKFAVVLFVMILVFTTSASYISISAINDILAISTSKDDVEVKIPENATYDQIIDLLSDNGLVKQKHLCKLFAQFRHFDNTKKYKFLSGIYTFDRSMGVEGMLLKCMAAPQTADTIKLSFPEGWTITQMFEKLNKYDVCSTEKLYSALNKVDYEFSFVDNVVKSDEKYQNFEGYLFPDTYDFYLNADANYVIRKFLSSFNTHWTEDYQKRADKLGYSMEEIITIASIIQKEAADASQMKIVSSIIHNRLKNSVSYPTLGCDSTSVYITNYVTKVVGLAKGNEFLKLYDTSANKGLPPGPICNPGDDAIEAALYPEESNYYFFLHDSKGKIYLAKNQKEHEANQVQAIKATGN